MLKNDQIRNGKLGRQRSMEREIGPYFLFGCRDQWTAELVRILKFGCRDPWTAKSVRHFWIGMQRSMDAHMIDDAIDDAITLIWLMSPSHLVLEMKILPRMLNLNEKYFTISERRRRNDQNKFCLRPLKGRVSPWELTNIYVFSNKGLVNFK